MFKTSCPICNGESFSLKYRLADYWYDPQGPQYDYYECTQCKLLIQSPMLTSEELYKHYRESDRYEKVDSRGVRGIYHKIGLRKRASILRGIPPGNMLDIGFGHGEFISFMSSIGWHVAGTEINDSSIKSELPQNAEIFYGELEALKLPDANYDLVSMWDVLEHQRDMHAVLLEIKRISKPDGLLLIRVPNSQSLDAALFREFWAGNDAPRHLYVFNETNLERLLEKHSFRVLRKKKHIGNYLNFVKSVQFWVQSQKPGRKWAGSLLRLLRNPYFRLCIYPLFFIKDLFSQGTSVTVLAKQKDNCNHG